jgi:hypothetical protein
MRVKRSPDFTLRIELSFVEARVLLDELLDVRGGARLPKVRQVCRELRLALGGLDHNAGRTEELIARGKIIPLKRVGKEKDPP